MKKLGFRIDEQKDWPASSGLIGPMPRRKIRDDGRNGPAMGDEALLYDLLMTAWQTIEVLNEEIATLRQQLEKKGKR